MGQINLLKTDTPQTPASGRTGIFVSLAGQPKKIDDDGTESNLAGISDAPSDGTQYVRKDATWVNPTAGGYPEMQVREDNQLLFDNDYSTGIEAAARSGNITASFTGAKRGACTVMRHNDASAFTYPTENIIISGTYEASVDNYLFFLLVNKTASSEVILCTISQEI